MRRVLWTRSGGIGYSGGAGRRICRYLLGLGLRQSLRLAQKLLLLSVRLGLGLSLGMHLGLGCLLQLCIR